MAGPIVRAAAIAVGIDPKVFNSVAQNGHLLAGLCAVFGPAAVMPYAWRFVGFGLIIAWAAAKEGIYDRYFEAADVRGSSWEDFAFYVLGGMIALGLVLVWGCA